MTQDTLRQGKEELAHTRKQSRGLYLATGLFSICINVLMLTGPLFMLQVYDRVLGSGSEATLVALFAIVGFLYLMMGLLDGVRSRVLTRIGARFQVALEERVFKASMQRDAVGAQPQGKASEMDDLSAIKRFLSSPVMAAIYDLPFVPLFLFGIALFHPLLGYLAVGGGVVLVAVTLANRAMSQTPQNIAARAETFSSQMAARLGSEAEAIRALGMQGAAYKRWFRARKIAAHNRVQAADVTMSFAAMSKALRLFLQSAMLALGAWLVLQREISPGAMIASSILLGRALQPVDIMIGQWSSVQRAILGWTSLAELLGRYHKDPKRHSLPRPTASLDVQNLTVIPPGQAQASLRMVSFKVEPTEAIGVIGQSGAGKSTLARALTSVWAPSGGSIRLSHAKLDQYDPDVLGTYIGYLPQRVQLFDGTIAENIAKLSDTPDDAAVVAAARKADAHAMILSLPNGYDTLVSSSGGLLSGGQLQRIGLARAFYGDPVLVILDEPNSNLDNDGSTALNAAIRRHKQEGGSVLIMAHRPSAIQECEKLLVLDKGGLRAFGPRDAVLKQMVQNSQDIIRKSGPGGVQ
ncbi:ATP-binding cassette subfamily C protein [Pacificibacter maritimus]|uniref:ATP-binding cassette subfamily C protein n=1 Tax=Pacificibacter maritimus TaxID=762213 RepID=A0A3N4UR59_9RHOB|nr:type I secretion system permease/ATPase [Pacificibacter maritimus]RPE63174.1 ATP-binding cassette subfamily C protein [Pacificibacter maritimus]